MDNKQKNVNLNIVSPVIPCDGNAIGVNPDGSLNLLFFQIHNQSDDSVDANSVSVIKLTREQLGNLAKSIQDALKETEKQKPETKKKK